MGAYFTWELSTYLGIEKSLGKIILFTVAIITSKILFGLIENQKYELSIDIDWIYRVLLFKIYKVCTYPIAKILKILENNLQKIVENWLGFNSMVLSDRGFVRRFGSLSWAIMMLFAIIILTYGLFYY